MNEAFKLAVMKSMEDFGLQVRMHCDYDAEQFCILKTLLSELATALRDEAHIDKDLALDLYALPQIVRNMFLSYEGPATSRPAQFDRLEDAWVDIDALVLDCLQPPAA